MMKTPQKKDQPKGKKAPGVGGGPRARPKGTRAGNSAAVVSPPKQLRFQERAIVYPANSWVDQAPVFLPWTLRFLKFSDLCRVVAVCRTWRAVALSCDPALFGSHLASALAYHQARFGRTAPAGEASTPATETAIVAEPGTRQSTKVMGTAVCAATHGNSLLMLRLVVLHNLEKICHSQTRAVSLGKSYAVFLRRAVPIARTYNAIAVLLSLVLSSLENAMPGVSLGMAWAPTSDLADCARFVLSSCCALATVVTTEEEFVGKQRASKPLPLRIFFQKPHDFGLFMSPLSNTVHVSSFDAEFLAEQFANAARSLSRFNAICGVCSSVAEVESRVSSLLGLRGIIRDPALTDAEHAHALFKMALYAKELSGSLCGVTIKPTIQFSVSTKAAAEVGGCVVELLWCASWFGRQVDDSTSSDDMDDSDEEGEEGDSSGGDEIPGDFPIDD